MAGKGNKWSKKAVIILLIASLAAVLWATVLMATEASTQVAGKTLEGPGFFTGSLVKVEGTVEGTTFALGDRIWINGVINGDLIAAGQTIVINGQVNGNIYMAGRDLELGTICSGDVFMAGQYVNITDEATLGRDLFVAGQKITLDGQVGRLLKGTAEEIILSGTVGKDASLYAASIRLLNGSSIGGDLIYQSENQAYIEPGAVISGETDWEQVQPAAERKEKDFGPNWLTMLLGIASALLIWFVIRLWKPHFWPGIAEIIERQPWRVLGIGLLALLLTPLLVILLMITIIGLPLGIILALVYGIMIYLSKIFAAVFMGAWLTKRFDWSEVHKGIWPVLLSLVILVLLFQIPVVGFIMGILVVLIGLGALIADSWFGKSEV